MIILAAFMVAFIASVLFAIAYRNTSFAPLAIFFVVLFFAGLAGQYWIVPFGPNWWGISWGPLLFIVLISTLLFAAPSPYRTRRTDKETDMTTSATISIFLWFLLITLILVILLGYYYHNRNFS